MHMAIVFLEVFMMPCMPVGAVSHMVDGSTCVSGVVKLSMMQQGDVNVVERTCCICLKLTHVIVWYGPVW